MPDLETLLRNTTPDSVQGVDLHALHRRGRRRRYAAKASAAVVGVASIAAVLVAVTTVVSPPGDGPQLGPVSGGPPAAPPDAWTEVALDVAFGEACTAVGQRDCARLSDVVWDHGRFVAAGTDGRGPLVLTSEHGRDWNAVSLPVPDGAVGGWVNALAVGGDGQFVAVGGLDRGPSSGAAPAYDGAAWISPDGVAWETAELGPGVSAYELTDVTRYGGGFVATALTGGGSLATNLQLVTSSSGTSWAHGPILGGPLPPLEQAPVVGVEAGPEVVVHATVAGACEPGLAVWRSGGKDLLPAGYVNGDDPARPDTMQPTTGLEDIVPVPCPTIEQTDVDGEPAGAWQLHAAPAFHVRWTPAGPTFRSYLPVPDGDGYVQHEFAAVDGGWQDTGPIAGDDPVDLVTSATTDGYHLAWNAIDDPWSTDDGTTAHAVGDGVGRALEVWLNSDGTWRRAEGPDTPGGEDRAGSTDLARVQIQAGSGCSDPDTSALGASATVLSQDRGVTVGLAVNCLAEGRPRPALWLGPLP